MTHFGFRSWGWLLLAATAPGGTILTLDQSVVSGAPGQSVLVFGNVANTANIEVFLSGATANTQFPLQSDAAIFFSSAAPFLTPDFSLPGLQSTPSVALLTVLIPANTAPGTYAINDFRLQGGLQAGDSFDIASVGFAVTVTPEPAPAWLLLAGAFWGVAWRAASYRRE